MEIGDKLELVERGKLKCSHCAFNDHHLCPSHDCGDGYFKLIPKQNHITFKNVSSNILHDNQGNQKLLDLVLPITPENIEQVHQAYRKTGKLTVDIYLDKEGVK